MTKPDLMTSVDCLDAAVRRRRAASSPITPLDAFRWVNGAGDGADPGLVIDKYAAHLVVQARPTVPQTVVGAWIEACIERLKPASIVRKTVTKQAGAATSKMVYGALDEGAPVVVREGDARFECRLNEGLQTGLFFDHRETRQAIRAWAKDVEVLNLFAYTASFSVHAALAGARRVTSVDASKRALRWGRANMVANGVSPDDHRWFTDDVVGHLRRGAEKQYGLIVLDPPVLGRAKGRTFSLTQQLDELLWGAIRKLSNDGVLVFSTHARALTVETLMSQVQAAADANQRSFRCIQELGLPGWDHPVRDDAGGFDRGDYLKTLVLRFA